MPATGPRAFSAAAMSRARILLVQNIQTQGNGTRRFLESSGHEVLWAGSGLSALITARNAGVDLILLDVALPDMEGLDLCRRFRHRDDTRLIPIILLVGRGHRPAPYLRPEDRPDEYLEKPYSAAELNGKINAVLTARAQRIGAGQAMRPEPQPAPAPVAPRPVLKLVEKQAPSPAAASSRSASAPEAAPISAPGAASEAGDAITDPATGLFSRSHFEAIFSKAFKQCVRFKQQMSCMMIDLDGTAMDRIADPGLVKALVGLVQQTIREVDTAAWWTGGSLIVLLPNTLRNDAVQAAARVLEAVAVHPFTWPDATRVTMSIGVAGLPDKSIDTEQKLLDAAAEACRKAREVMARPWQAPAGSAGQEPPRAVAAAASGRG